MPSLTIDTVSFDTVRDQFALYLVESEPLPDDADARRVRLKAIQDRMFDAFDAAVDGHVAAKFPESLGQSIRIQVDCPFGREDDIEFLVSRVASYFQDSSEHANAVKDSRFVNAVHVVSGHQLGRFQHST